jgi:hypothetical protein
VRAALRGVVAGLLVSTLPALSACSGSGGDTPSPTPTVFTRGAAAYLVSLDQLRVARFTVAEAPHGLGFGTASAGDSQLGTALRANGMQDAATVRYFRQVPDLATANGFIDVRSTVLRFAAAGPAHRAFLAEVRHTDEVPHIVPESTDALGDEAHGDLLTETSPDGVQVVEATVIVRNANLVELVIVRGRVGGTSLDDALILAHRQLASQR